MKTLIFISVIVAIFIGSTLFGALLADKKATTGSDYLKKIILPMFVAALFLTFFEVGWFMERFGCSLFEEVSGISYNNGIFFPMFFAFGLSFFLLLFYRIKNFEIQKAKEFVFLLLPSFIGMLLNSVPIIELIIN